MKRDHLLTEQRLPESMNLDAMGIRAAVDLMQSADETAVAAVAAVADAIAAGVELVASAFRAGGRLIYVGAGTSGRLGALDAAECPPTFRTPPEQVVGILAGGPDAMFRAREGVEDDADAGAAAIDEHAVGPRDVVCGIAAGGTTPFVHGALLRAIARGARTIFLSCVQPVDAEPTVDVVIRPLTGPEVLTGSTRLKAATATKMILNRLSTLAMVQVGKCHGNLMVDLRATNAKLRDRALRIVAALTDLDPAAAAIALDAADGHVKLAVLMARLSLDLPTAQRRLDAAAGSLRQALADMAST